MKTFREFINEASVPVNESLDGIGPDTIEKNEVPARGSKFRFRNSGYNAMPKNTKKFVADLMKKAEIEGKKGNNTNITFVKWGRQGGDTALIRMYDISPEYRVDREGWYDDRGRQYSESDIIKLFDTPEYVGFISRVFKRTW